MVQRPSGTLVMNTTKPISRQWVEYDRVLLNLVPFSSCPHRFNDANEDAKGEAGQYEEGPCPQRFFLEIPPSC